MKKILKSFTYREKNDVENCKFIFDIEFDDVRFYVDENGFFSIEPNGTNDKIVILKVSFGDSKIYINNVDNLELKFKENKYCVGNVIDIEILDEITHGTSYKSKLKYFYKKVLLNNEERILISSTYEKDNLFLLTDREFKLIYLNK